MPSQEVGNDLGVEDGAPVGDPLDGIGECDEIEDAVFEEVTEAGRLCSCQLQRVPLLDDLRKEQEAEVFRRWLMDRLQEAAPIQQDEASLAERRLAPADPAAI